VIAVIATIVGVLVVICIMPVPTFILLVMASAQAAGVTASCPQDSDVQREENPRLSASFINVSLSEKWLPLELIVKPSFISDNPRILNVVFNPSQNS
jgi:hypothetical protein